MQIKNGVEKHRYSSFFSWIWSFAGLLVFVGIHRIWFLPIFMEQFHGDLSAVRPLYLGACVSYIFVSLMMTSGRRLPYANNFEVLLLTSLSTVAALLLFLAANREFYSLKYLLTLFVAQTVWFGGEVYFRSRFVSYTFAIFPTSLPLSVDDFVEQKVILLKSDSPPIHQGVDAIVVDFNVKLEPAWLSLLAEYQNSSTPIIPLNTFLENVWGRIPVELFEGTPAFVDISFRPYLLVKPLVERFLALLGLIVSSPILLAAIIGVKLERQGSTFFLQERVGQYGRPFTIFKLRTMREDDGAPEDAIETSNPDRITRFGAILRKYHVDELPQLLNVLKGDMALVGPRPEASGLAKLYSTEIPEYCLRTRMLPGIVSWALIHQGNVLGIDEARIKLSYDFFYLKHVSCFLDFYILLKSIWIVLFGVERLRSPNELRIFPRR